jgi:hypothetical protein
MVGTGKNCWLVDTARRSEGQCTMDCPIPCGPTDQAAAAVTDVCVCSGLPIDTHHLFRSSCPPIVSASSAAQAYELGLLEMVWDGNTSGLVQTPTTDPTISLRGEARSGKACGGDTRACLDRPVKLDQCQVIGITIPSAWAPAELWMRNHS